MSGASDNGLVDDEPLMNANELFGDDGEDNGGGTDEDVKEGNGDDEESNSEDDTSKPAKSASRISQAKKRMIRNPRFMLNFQRLKSENGIPALLRSVEKFRFRGDHHEKEDLGEIIRCLHFWMHHQLYPSCDPDLCMRALENLGKKREVQAYMRKLRRESRQAVLAGKRTEVTQSGGEGDNRNEEFNSGDLQGEEVTLASGDDATHSDQAPEAITVDD